jgi:hypothetical protein
VGDVEFLQANQQTGKVPRGWAAAQVATSADFAHGSWFWTHFSGGLNYQARAVECCKSRVCAARGPVPSSSGAACYGRPHLPGLADSVSQAQLSGASCASPEVVGSVAALCRLCTICFQGSATRTTPPLRPSCSPPARSLKFLIRSSQRCVLCPHIFTSSVEVPFGLWPAPCSVNPL